LVSWDEGVFFEKDHFVVYLEFLEAKDDDSDYPVEIDEVARSTPYSEINLILLMRLQRGQIHTSKDDNRNKYDK
jgi:hypothetical protein